MNMHMYIVALVHLKPVVSAHKAKRIAKRAFFPPLQQTTPMPYANPIDPLPNQHPLHSVLKKNPSIFMLPSVDIFVNFVLLCALCLFFCLSPPTLFAQALFKCKSKPVSHTRTQRGCACVRWFNDSTPFPIVLSIKKSKKKMKKKQKMLPGSNNKMPYT